MVETVLYLKQPVDLTILGSRARYGAADGAHGAPEAQEELGEFPTRKQVAEQLSQVMNGDRAASSTIYARDLFLRIARSAGTCSGIHWFVKSHMHVMCKSNMPRRCP